MRYIIWISIFFFLTNFYERNTSLVRDDGFDYRIDINAIFMCMRRRFRYVFFILDIGDTFPAFRRLPGDANHRPDTCAEQQQPLLDDKICITVGMT